MTGCLVTLQPVMICGYLIILRLSISRLAYTNSDIVNVQVVLVTAGISTKSEFGVIA